MEDTPLTSGEAGVENISVLYERELQISKELLEERQPDGSRSKESYTKVVNLVNSFGYSQVNGA